MDADDVRIRTDIAETLVNPKAYADRRIREAYRWLRANNPLGVAEPQGLDVEVDEVVAQTHAGGDPVADGARRRGSMSMSTPQFGVGPTRRPIRRCAHKT